MDVTITLNVNGKERTVTAAPERPLLDVLREDLDLTGAKYCCGEGRCGACTVLMDGNRVLSCITPVTRAEGKAITTIEGLVDGDFLHRVQEAFLAVGTQCGYCLPAMILSTVALLKTNPHPTDGQIVEWMNGYMCRCCTYPQIVAAVRRAADLSAGVKVQ